MADHEFNSGNPRVDIEYRRKKSKEEMRYQIVSFTMMIFLTFIAFGMVAAKDFSHWFTVPIILLLAVVQVIFQLYYFMHMNQKGHEAPSLFLFTGLGVGLTAILTFMTIVLW